MYDVTGMARLAFAGFGEINTPYEILVKKCEAALCGLKKIKLNVTAEAFPITDDRDEKDINCAVETLKNAEFDVLVICIAGWIPSHAVVKVTEQFRHLPMVLWGLAGWYEDGRLVTTADQAGTSALRKVFADLGYTFKYVYDIAGKAPNVEKVKQYCIAASAVKKLRKTKAGMMGYRDMNLYGTLYDGTSLKRAVGIEIETFEMLETEQRYQGITYDEKLKVVQNCMHDWKFLKTADVTSLMKAAGYYLALKQIIEERKYEAISLKDVDGMKKLLGYPPAPIFMLLANELGIPAVPENDSLGSATQLMIKYVTGQCGAYLEFYEFMEDRVLAGVPDFIPEEITDGEITVMPAAFGELSQGILNVSKVKQGTLTLCRLFCDGGKYFMHMVKGEGIAPRKWEEAGWTQPAPQLPGLEILLDDTDKFAQNVMCQHYFISYGDNAEVVKDLCGILKIEVI